MKIFQKHAIPIIFGLALLVRLVVLGLTYKGPDIEYWENVKIAINMIEGRGYAIDFSVRNDAYNDKYVQNPAVVIPRSEGIRPTAFKPPVYTLLVYFTFIVFGIKNFLALFFIQAILSSLTCVFIFITLRAYSERVAALAALGVAVYPSFVFHAVTSPENTTLGLLLISVFLYCLVKLHNYTSSSKWLVTGGVSASLALTEVVAIPFIFLSILYLLLVSNAPGKYKMQGAAIFVVSFAIFTSPWLIRNYLVFNHPFLFKSSAGHIMLVGLYNANNNILIRDEILQDLEVSGRGKTEVQEDKAIQKEVVKSIFENSEKYIKEIIPQNFSFYWWETKRFKNNNSLKYLLGRKIPYLILLLFALPSILRNLFKIVTTPLLSYSCRENIIFNSSLFLISTFTVIYVIFGPVMLRYHFPVELLLFVYAASTLFYLIKKIKYLVSSGYMSSA